MDSADAIAHDDWHTLLDAHPILRPPTTSQSDRDKPFLEQPLVLSTSTLQHEYVLSSRRQLMALKDADIIVAAGSELRMTSLWDTKLGRETGNTYKVLHVPTIDFHIRQLALNPSGKLLGIAEFDILPQTIAHPLYQFVLSTNARSPPLPPYFKPKHSSATSTTLFRVSNALFRARFLSRHLDCLVSSPNVRPPPPPVVSNPIAHPSPLPPCFKPERSSPASSPYRKY